MAERTEIEMLRMPCGHLVDMPATATSMVQCDCGRLWQVVHRRGEWTARNAEAI